MSMQYYPVFMDLRGRRVVVIGGGKLALEKVEGLVKAGACVTLIAREVIAPLQPFVVSGRITHWTREYRDGDLREAFLVISTLNEREANERIYREASARN